MNAAAQRWAHMQLNGAFRKLAAVRAAFVKAQAVGRQWRLSQVAAAWRTWREQAAYRRAAVAMFASVRLLPGAEMLKRWRHQRAVTARLTEAFATASGVWARALLKEAWACLVRLHTTQNASGVLAYRAYDFVRGGRTERAYRVWAKLARVRAGARPSRAARPSHAPPPPSLPDPLSHAHDGARGGARGGAPLRTPAHAYLSTTRPPPTLPPPPPTTLRRRRSTALSSAHCAPPWADGGRRQCTLPSIGSLSWPTISASSPPPSARYVHDTPSTMHATSPPCMPHLRHACRISAMHAASPPCMPHLRHACRISAMPAAVAWSLHAHPTDPQSCRPLHLRRPAPTACRPPNACSLSLALPCADA